MCLANNRFRIEGFIKPQTPQSNSPKDPAPPTLEANAE